MTMMDAIKTWYAGDSSQPFTIEGFTLHQDYAGVAIYIGDKCDSQGLIARFQPFYGEAMYAAIEAIIDEAHS